jgi:hypothetical protein
MKPLGSRMKQKSKPDLCNEIEILRGISLALYKELEKTPQTVSSKQAMDDFIKYVTEKV